MKFYFLLQTMKPLNHTTGMLATILGIIVSYDFVSISPSGTLFGLIYFMLFYSAIYQMNEVFDVKRDASDPVRSQRALASGKIATSTVISSAIFLGIVSTIALAFVNEQIIMWLAFLTAINLLYVLILKQFRYLDFILMSFSHWMKFIVGTLLVTTTILPSGLYIIGFYCYCVVAALQCNKKIGRILYQKGNTKALGNRTILLLLKYVFIGLMISISMTKVSQIPFFLLVATITFLFYNLIIDLNRHVQRLFFHYQKWFSTL